MSEEKANLDTIRISLELLSPHGPAGFITDSAFRALASIVASCASNLCWTYTPPGDGSVLDDDDFLSRLTMLSKRRWRKVRPEVAQFFVIRNGRWHLKESWIAIDDRPIRYAIPVDVQKSVLTRSGKVCTYCGNTDGPFDFDHIFPVSLGGANDASNITLACASCNRSKGAKTLREWSGR